MGQRLKPLDQMKWIAISTPTTAAFSWSAFYTLDSMGVHFPEMIINSSPMIGVTAALGCWTYYQFGLLRNSAPSRRPRWSDMAKAMAKDSRVYVNVPAPADSPDIKTTRTRHIVDAKPSEFVFDHEFLPTRLPETRLHKFLDIARRRQNAAIHGTGIQFRRVKINWVLSRKWFTESARPRWPVSDYDACMIVLGLCDMIAGKPGQGNSGHLMGNEGPSKMVDDAVNRWMQLYHAAPPPSMPGKIFEFARKIPASISSVKL